MTFEEAKKLVLQVPWKIGTCNSGEKCWCRVIKPVTPIIFDEFEEYIICSDGAISKDIAEHIVKLHNESLSKSNIYKSIELNNLTNLKNP